VILTRTGHGMHGCAPLTNAERLQAYARALCGHFDAHDHARRAAAGLAILKRLRVLWRKRKPKKAQAPKPRATKTNVVPMRRRA
jgi:hypothetical protein